MAERLTDKVLLKKLVNGYYGDIDVYQKSYIKLGMLEDILEKYGIESVEELEDKIICYEENKDVNLGLKLDIKKIRTRTRHLEKGLRVGV